MERSPTVRLMLRLATAAILLFIYLPIALIVVYAFNTNRVPTWPPAPHSQIPRMVCHTSPR